MKVLVYGFEPFLGLDENPSELVAKALDGRRIAGANVEALVLPVKYGVIERRLLEVIRRAKPDLVMGLGLYQGLPKLGVTKLAANFVYSQSADNLGKIVRKPRVDGRAPDGIFMSIPSEGVVDYLNRRGIPAVLLVASPDAFVCNLSMFVVAREARKSGFACGFIHLPFTKGFVAKKPAKKTPGMNLSRMVAGVEEAITYCLREK